MLKIAFWNQLQANAQPLLTGAKNFLHTAGQAASPEGRQQLGKDFAQGAISNVGSSVSGMFDKYAPYLALPVAFGMMGSMGGQNGGGLATQRGPNNMTPAQPNYIQPLSPEGFKTAGLFTGALMSAPNRVISNLVDKKMNKGTVDIQESNSDKKDIKGTNTESKKLLSNPHVQDYVHDLINS